MSKRAGRRLALVLFLCLVPTTAVCKTVAHRHAPRAASRFDCCSPAQGVVQGVPTYHDVATSQSGNPIYRLGMGAHGFVVSREIYDQTARPRCYVVSYSNMRTVTTERDGQVASARPCPPGRSAAQAHIEVPADVELKGGDCTLDGTSLTGGFPPVGKFAPVLTFVFGAKPSPGALGTDSQPYHGPGTYTGAWIAINGRGVDAFGDGTVVVNDDRETGRFQLDFGSGPASGTFDCGTILPLPGQ